MFSKTILVSVLNIISIILSFASNVIIGRVFADGPEYNSFVASSTLPNYLIAVIAGSLSFTFLPVLSESKSHSVQERRNFINSTCITAAFIALIVVIIMLINSEFIISNVVTGFDTEQKNLTRKLFSIYLPIVIFTVFNELISGLFYSENNFLIPLASKLISPILSILSVLFLFQLLGIYSLSFALLLGSATQSILLANFSNKVFKHRFIFEINLYSRRFKKFITIIIPLLFSSILYRVFPVIDTYILSKFNTGAIAINSYAVKLNGALVACFSAIFSIQIFAQFSKLNSMSNMKLFKDNLSYYMRVIYNLTIPTAILIYINAEELISIVYEGGNFINLTTVKVSKILEIYSIFLPIIVVGATISQALYSLMLTKKVMLVGLLEAIFYTISILMFYEIFKEKIVPIVYGINFLLSTLILALILRKKIGLGGGVGVLKSFIRILILSIIIVTFYYFPLKWFVANEFVKIILHFTLTISTYIFITYLLNFEETKLIIDKITTLIRSNDKTY